jgi:hypothetical protein
MMGLWVAFVTHLLCSLLALSSSVAQFLLQLPDPGMTENKMEKRDSRVPTAKTREREVKKGIKQGFASSLLLLIPMYKNQCISVDGR